MNMDESSTAKAIPGPTEALPENLRCHECILQVTKSVPKLLAPRAVLLDIVPLSGVLLG